WMYESVDRYVVASEEAKQRFMHDGIPEDKVKIMGIPIDVRFSENKPKDPIKEKLSLALNKRVVLIMGGGGGLGPIKAIVSILQKLSADIQIVVATGTNTKLYKYLVKRAPRFKKRLIPLEYSDNIDELMEISDVVITKPGGITVSEALAKCLPILIINPIPGQEAKNTKFLIKSGAAVKAENETELSALLENLFSMPSKLKTMAGAAGKISKPKSALDIAEMILNL
ncbi:MAG: glycosyltransferase, partial [Candidatus Omnitrophota bacterium]